MSETDNSKQIAVGVFIFVGLMILIVGILTIGGQRKTFVKTFAVKVVLDDVSGLQSGSNVWLSGVKIGMVKKIKFTGQNQVEINLSIEKQVQQYVRKDSRARIGSDGLIGNKLVVVYGGTADAGSIADGDYLQTEHGANTEDMAATLLASNKNLLEITGDFKTLSKRLIGREGMIGALINDAALAGKMRATIANLNQVSVNSEKVITSLISYTAGLSKQGVFANQLVSDTVIFRELKGTVSQLREAAVAAAAFSEKLKAAGDGLNQTNTPVGLLLHDPVVAMDMKTTIRNLQLSSQKLDEDLEALQHNFLLRGFFRKRAKEKAKQAPLPANPPPTTTIVPDSGITSTIDTVK
jgi:phospholipid/cholesterol/gamma-HCH transport system substrate-binding protein